MSPSGYRAASAFERDLTYLTTVMATAQVHMGRMREAQKLLVARWSSLDHAGEFSLSLRELWALTREGDRGESRQARLDRRVEETSLKSP